MGYDSAPFGSFVLWHKSPRDVVGVALLGRGVTETSIEHANTGARLLEVASTVKAAAPWFRLDNGEQRQILDGSR